MRLAKAGISLPLFLWAALAYAQETCPLPPAIQPVGPPTNIFSDQQEIDLGDAMAESIAQNLRIMENDDLTSYLRTIGDRIVQHLPATKMKFRFYLVELPEVNAFSITGGRVYVSRKLVALARTDDELAGVVAHELGHIVTHQTAISITRRLREVLGVTEVGDRADIFLKFHQLMENGARKPPKNSPNEEKEQYTADQVGLYAMARAGYAPHAYVDLWDRFQQTRGKTGGWLASLFLEITPAQRRLGEMVKNVSALPAGCADIPSRSHSEEFSKWQTEVINYVDTGAKESLPGLLLKQTLSLPLRPDISNLHFSPDSKYILAQDDGGMHVLTREPLAVLFYIPAVDALDAKFTPDSQFIVFHNSALRVESWSIAEQKRTSVHELALLHPCVQTELSPDGAVLACLDEGLQLSLVAIASGTTLATKRSFVDLTLLGKIVLFNLAIGKQDARFVEMHFSPDGRYFLAGAWGAHFAWDLSSQRELSLPGTIREVLKESFAFLGPDRITGIQTSAPEKSPILRFPGGERIGQLKFANGIRIRSVAKGEDVFVGPLRNRPWGLLDVRTGSISLEFKSIAADVYEHMLISERLTGELAIYALGKSEPQAIVKLPQARLGSLQAAAVSPDFQWLAMSNRARGAVWDIAHNIRTMELRSFRGAWVGPDEIFYVDVPKFEEVDRQIARLDPRAGVALAGYKIENVIAAQYGHYLLVTKPKKGQFRQFNDADLEIQDIHDGRVIWTHHFPHELPKFSFSGGNVLLTWPVASDGGRSELQHYPELKNQGGDQDYFCELKDLKTDATLGELRINTNKGSFSVEYTFLAGNWLVVSARNNQVLTYRFADGKEIGHFFGRAPSASPSSNLLALDDEVGHLKLYDLATSELRRDYVFSDPILFKLFSDDGKRLLVLTASQTVYILDTAAL